MSNYRHRSVGLKERDQNYAHMNKIIWILISVLLFIFLPPPHSLSAAARGSGCNTLSQFSTNVPVGFAL